MKPFPFSSADTAPAPQTPSEFVAEGTFLALRDSGWREKLKGRRVQILDGKWSGKLGTFKGWSGTVAYVSIDGVQDTVGLAVKRLVGVLRNDGPRGRQ